MLSLNDTVLSHVRLYSTMQVKYLIVTDLKFKLHFINWIELIITVLSFQTINITRISLNNMEGEGHHKLSPIKRCSKSNAEQSMCQGKGGSNPTLSHGSGSS